MLKFIVVLSISIWLGSVLASQAFELGNKINSVQSERIEKAGL